MKRNYEGFTFNWQKQCVDLINDNLYSYNNSSNNNNNKFSYNSSYISNSTVVLWGVTAAAQWVNINLVGVNIQPVNHYNIGPLIITILLITGLILININNK